MDKNEHFSAADLESQDHLTKEILSSLNCQFWPDSEAEKERPVYSFIELMKWAQKHFAHNLKDQDNLERLVQNRVIVDGQFMSFCKEVGATVTPLYKDSIISWNTDNNYEKFFVQGVFLIKHKKLEFLHAALFHKGNQLEDEISFFVILSNKHYETYCAFRNQFDQWLRDRDRSHLSIRVMDADDMPYTKDHNWDELFLPSSIKDELRHLVESFLVSRDFYLKNKIPWKRGVILYGPPGNGKTSIIRTIISEYNFKPVTIVAEANNEMVRDAFAYAESQSPSLLYFEDLDSLFEKAVDPSTFLNLMDGIATKNGLLVIATANEIRKLKDNITQRPSRFDRKFEIPPPNFEMSHIYLKRWFGGMIPASKCKELAKSAVKNHLSYAYLKELYISSMFEALSHNRKTPTITDIDNTLKRLIKDKNALGGNAISTDKYFG